MIVHITNVINLKTATMINPSTPPIVLQADSSLFMIRILVALLLLKFKLFSVTRPSDGVLLLVNILDG